MAKASELKKWKEMEELLRDDSKAIAMIGNALDQLGQVDDVTNMALVENFVSEARKKIKNGERVSEDQVFMTFFLLAACLSIASTMAALSLMRANQKVSGEHTVVDAAISSTLILFFQHLRAVELLCSEGLDTQAKILARSAIEAGDTAIVLSQNPEMAAKYVAVGDDKEGDEFWRQYFRSGKMSSGANRIFNEKFSVNSLGLDTGAWKNSELKFLSRSVHPTHAAGFMSILGNTFSKQAADGNVGEMTIGGGDPHLGSTRTATAISIQVMRLSMFFGEWRLQFNSKENDVEVKTLGEIGGIVNLVYGWLGATGNLQVEMAEEFQ